MSGRDTPGMGRGALPGKVSAARVRRVTTRRLRRFRYARRSSHNRAVVPTIYVTGHRNPDTDSIASAIGYAELKRRLDPNNDYVPVRLGDTNPQTNWLLERSGAPEPRFLPHV